MSRLLKLAAILEEGKNESEEILATGVRKDMFHLKESVRFGEPDSDNMLAYGDNLEFMKYLIRVADIGKKIDLIYIDPPFYSNADYMAKTKVKKKDGNGEIIYVQKAYKDTWGNGIEEYLRMLTERLFIMQKLLSDKGCIFIHLDWHVVHYVKVIADQIFGADNFVNEIVWHYKSGGVGKHHFGRKHDTILLYSKTKNYNFYTQIEKSYNRGYKPYYFKGVQEFKDKVGWYTLVNMKDVWMIDMVGRTSKERVNYATQKPEALLERIIKSCTTEGSICADFFAGSGTLAAAAQKMGRRWICCDNGELAMAKIQKRLCMQNGGFDYFVENRIGENPIENNSEGLGQAEETREHINIDVSLHFLMNSDRLKLEVSLSCESEHFIDYWSIDYNYEQVHRPDVHFFRDKNGIIQSANKTIDKLGKISIKINNILGNILYKVIDLQTVDIRPARVTRI